MPKPQPLCREAEGGVVTGPVATIRKNAGEELRVSVDEFHGRPLVGHNGEVRPGKPGLALRIDTGEKIESALSEMAPDAEITFERLAVSPDQITDWNLPASPTKTTNSRAKGFGDISVELDAIDSMRMHSPELPAVARVSTKPRPLPSRGVAVALNGAIGEAWL